MSYAKQFPIRVTLAAEDCSLLIEGLKNNESDYTGYIADDARALREKIEQHGRREPCEDSGEIVRLGFYENEGKKFVRQFIAAAKTVMDLNMEISRHEQIAELNESLINRYQRLMDLYEGHIGETATDKSD